MTNFEQEQINRVTRGPHNLEYLYSKIDQLVDKKHITVLQWMDEFKTERDLTLELDDIDNEGRLNNYSY